MFCGILLACWRRKLHGGGRIVYLVPDRVQLRWCIRSSRGVCLLGRVLCAIGGLGCVHWHDGRVRHVHRGLLLCRRHRGAGRVHLRRRVLRARGRGDCVHRNILILRCLWGSGVLLCGWRVPTGAMHM